MNLSTASVSGTSTRSGRAIVCGSFVGTGSNGHGRVTVGGMSCAVQRVKDRTSAAAAASIVSDGCAVQCVVSHISMVCPVVSVNRIPLERFVRQTVDRNKKRATANCPSPC
jgi:hypothetical protein